MLLLLNEHGDPSFFFQNLISHMYNINNKQAKFDKNLSVGSISDSGMTLSLSSAFGRFQSVFC